MMVIGFHFSSIAQFTAGNIVVLEVGDGATVNMTGGNSYKEQLVELPASGTAPVAAISTVIIPSTTGSGRNHRSVESASATSDGDLNLSGNGLYLTFTGYDTAAGITTLVGGSNINRIIGMVNNAKTVSFPASISSNTTNGLYQGNNIRAAITNDGTGFWTAGTGTNGGIYYITSGSYNTTSAGAVQLNSGLTNARTVKIFNSQLYGNAWSSPYLYPFKIGSGLPVTSSQTYTSLGLSSTDDSYSFVMFDRNRDGTPDLLYVTDNGTGTNTAGLYKYYWSGSAWTYSSRLFTGTALFGVTGYLDCSNNPVLFMTIASTGVSTGTTSGIYYNAIYTYTDNSTTNSSTMSGAPTVLEYLNSGAGQKGWIYKGVALAPTKGDLTITSNTTTSGSYRKVMVNSGTLTLNGNLAIADSIYIASGATLDCSTFIVTGRSFVLAAGATLKIGDPYGITTSGTTASSGNIRTSCRTFSTSANYVYEGTTAQLTGNALTTSNNLTINNTATFSGGGVTLNNDSINISGQLILTAGVLYSSPYMVKMLAGSSVSGVSNSSYVDGQVKKYGNTAFIFPVGNADTSGTFGYYAPISMTAPSLSTDNFTAQYFFTDPDPNYNSASKASTIDHISGCEYWILNRTGGSSNAFVTLSWSTNASYSSRSCGVTSLSDLVVAKWDGAVWRDYGQGSYTGNFNTGTVISASAIPSFSPFTLASGTPDNPLPIELLTFNANYNGTDVNLNWATASEKNNDYFNIERSADGVNFNSIARIKGAGNTSFTINYSDIDKNPLEGISYYRLKQTDFNGNYTYSDIRPITIIKSFSVIKVYPIPTDNVINIELNEKMNFPITIKITNILGELVYESTQIADKNISIDVTKLPASVYFVDLNSENYSYKTKVVKQ